MGLNPKTGLLLLLVFVSSPISIAHADQSYSGVYSLGHKYQVGDHVLAKFAGEYCDATIENLTSDGLAKVKFDSWSRAAVQGDDYVSILFDVKPLRPAQSYTDGILFTHTYKIGDRVLADFAGTPSEATITQLTTDGMVKVRFDSWSTEAVADGRYSAVSDLEPLVTDTTVASRAAGINPGLENALSSACPHCEASSQSTNGLKRANPGAEAPHHRIEAATASIAI